MNIQSCQSSFQLPRQLLPAEWLHQRWWLGWLRCSLWLSVRRSACPQEQQISGWTRIAKPGLSAFGRSLRSSCRQGIPLMKLLSLLNLWTTWMKGSFCVASLRAGIFFFQPLQVFDYAQKLIDSLPEPEVTKCKAILSDLLCPQTCWEKYVYQEQQDAPLGEDDCEGSCVADIPSGPLAEAKQNFNRATGLLLDLLLKVALWERFLFWVSGDCSHARRLVKSNAISRRASLQSAVHSPSSTAAQRIAKHHGSIWRSVEERVRVCSCPSSQFAYALEPRWGGGRVWSWAWNYMEEGAGWAQKVCDFQLPTDMGKRPHPQCFSLFGESFQLYWRAE